ncbi:MAG TPA: hypothetical protein VGB30_12140, partial [bacterium]
DEIIGYYMVAYGSYNNPGMDINEDWTNDHVILVLKGFRDGFESTPELLIEIFNQYLEISEESP